MTLFIIPENLVKTLDDEEVQFLDYVEEARQEEEKRKRLEEAKELSEFRSAVSELREKEIEKAINQEIKSVDVKKSKLASEEVSIGIKKTSQSQLLAGLVKRKSIPNPTTTGSPPTKQLKSGKRRQLKSQGILLQIYLFFTSLQMMLWSRQRKAQMAQSQTSSLPHHRTQLSKVFQTKGVWCVSGSFQD